MKRTLVAATSAVCAALVLAFSPPASADYAYPTSIDVYPYPRIASPAKYPVTVVGCGVHRERHRLDIGFSFKNIELDPMTSVKISVDLYDSFHNFLTTLDSTINGNYSPGAEIQVSEFPVAGNTMPLFYAHDEWPDAASAVCYVSNVLYANGDVWKASERPSFDVAFHALDDMVKNGAAVAHSTVAKELASQKALGFSDAVVLPSPVDIPAGWTSSYPGMYMYIHLPTLHQLSFSKLTGPGGKGPFKPSDIGLARQMEQVKVTDQHAVTICGGRPAEFMSLRGTFSFGPQTIDAIKIHANGVSYVSSYSRNDGAPPIADAEKALSDLCY